MPPGVEWGRAGIVALGARRWWTFGGSLRLLTGLDRGWGSPLVIFPFGLSPVNWLPGTLVPSLFPSMMASLRCRLLLVVHRRGRGHQYLVDWGGYGTEERSWVYANIIMAAALIEGFHPPQFTCPECLPCTEPLKVQTVFFGTVLVVSRAFESLPQRWLQP